MVHLLPLLLAAAGTAVPPRPIRAPAAPVDVLFVIDDSGSMLDDGIDRKLGDPIDAFITPLLDERIDFQLAITTTDMSDPKKSGELVGGRYRVIDRRRPSPAGDFRENLKLCFGGSGHERGLDAAAKALLTEAIRGESGFLRPEARLLVVFVSDEQDGSRGDVEGFVKGFLAIKRDPTHVAITTLTGPASCGAKKDAMIERLRARGMPAELLSRLEERNRYDPARDRYRLAAEKAKGTSSDLCAPDLTPFVQELAVTVRSLAAPSE